MYKNVWEYYYYYYVAPAALCCNRRDSDDFALDPSKVMAHGGIVLKFYIQTQKQSFMCVAKVD